MCVSERCARTSVRLYNKTSPSYAAVLSAVRAAAPRPSVVAECCSTARTDAETTTIPMSALTPAATSARIGRERSSEGVRFGPASASHRGVEPYMLQEVLALVLETMSKG